MSRRARPVTRSVSRTVETDISEGQPQPRSTAKPATIIHKKTPGQNLKKPLINELVDSEDEQEKQEEQDEQSEPNSPVKPTSQDEHLSDNQEEGSSGILRKRGKTKPSRFIDPSLLDEVSQSETQQQPTSSNIKVARFGFGPTKTTTVKNTSQHKQSSTLPTKGKKTLCKLKTILGVLALFFVIISAVFIHDACEEHTLYLQMELKKEEQRNARLAEANKKSGSIWSKISNLAEDTLSGAISSIKGHKDEEADLDLSPTRATSTSSSLHSTITAFQSSDSHPLKVIGTALEQTCNLTLPARNAVSSIAGSIRNMLITSLDFIESQLTGTETSENSFSRASMGNRGDYDDDDDDDDDGNDDNAHVHGIKKNRADLSSPRVIYTVDSPFVSILDGTKEASHFTLKEKEEALEHFFNVQALTSRLSIAVSSAIEEHKASLLASGAKKTARAIPRGLRHDGTIRATIETDQTTESEWERSERLERYVKPSAVTLAVFDPFQSNVITAKRFVSSYNPDIVSLIEISIPSDSDIVKSLKSGDKSKTKNTNPAPAPSNEDMCSEGIAIVMNSIEVAYRAASENHYAPVFFIEVASLNLDEIPRFCVVKALHTILDDSRKDLSGSLFIFPVKAGKLTQTPPNPASHGREKLKSNSEVCELLNVWKDKQTIPEHFWSPLRARMCNAVAGVY